jgi:hypothetical protein
MAKKKAKKKASKKVDPRLCLRHIDANTIRMSDNVQFRAYNPAAAENLPEGTFRVDKNTVISVPK